jgi:eukaryotic-like serine/threonine-protein kinase
MFHLSADDLTHSGVYSAIPPKAFGKKPNWVFEAGHGCSSAAISDGVLYFGNSQDSFFAVDAKTGKEIWTTGVSPENLPHKDYLAQIPAPFGSLIIVRRYGDEIIGVDRKTGRISDKFKAWKGVSSTPKVINDAILIAGDGYAASLDQEGNPNWLIEFKEISWTPVVNNETAIFHIDPNSFWAIHIRTGKTQWKNTLRTWTGDCVGYFFYEGLLFVLEDAQADILGKTRFHVIDAADGEELGVYDTLPICYKTGYCVDEGRFYFSSLSGDLYCYDLESGRGQWVFQTSGQIFHPPKIAGKFLFFGNKIGELYMIGKKNGKLVDRIITPDRNIISTFPLIWSSRVFFGDVAGNYYSWG